MTIEQKANLKRLGYHRQNLIQLAEYLEGGTKENTRFDMAYYYDDSTSDGFSTTCGSAGCAVGHGPYAGIPKEVGEAWDDYCERVFGVDTDVVHDAYSFLFGSEWEQFDNTPKGAARRIRYYLDNGVPEEWGEFGWAGQWLRLSPN